MMKIELNIPRLPRKISGFKKNPATLKVNQFFNDSHSIRIFDDANRDIRDSKESIVILSTIR